MIFSREVSHDEMMDIANNRNNDPSGEPSCYILRCDGDNYGDPDLFKMYSVRKEITGIRIDPVTEAWTFIVEDPEEEVMMNTRVFPTLADVNEHIKSCVRFWQTDGLGAVYGWNRDEVAFHKTYDAYVERSTSKLFMTQNYIGENWKEVIEKARIEADSIIKPDDKDEFLKLISDFEKRAKEKYNS